MGKLHQVNMRWRKRKDGSGVGADAVRSFRWVLKGRMGLIGERVEVVQREGQRRTRLWEIGKSVFVRKEDLQG